MVTYYECPIGKNYYPQDNSLNASLSMGEPIQLSGNRMNKPVLTTIISNPIAINYWDAFGQKLRNGVIVIVETGDGRAWSTIWDEKGLEIDRIDKEWK